MAPSPARQLDVKMAAGLGLASLLAFGIATALGFGHAYWAPMSVWVVAQPYRDHAIERGLLRLAGTLIGAVAGSLILLAGLDPVPSLVLVCLWVGLVGGAQNLWDGRGRYLTFMAAMTGAVVVLPAILSGAPGIGLAVDRMICVAIGVTVAMVVVGLITPPAPEREERAAERQSPSRRAWRWAMLAGAAAGLGTLACGLAALAADFPPAGLGALGFSIFALILSGAPNPKKLFPVLLTGVAMGAAAGAFYRIGVLPLVQTTPGLILSVLPFIAIGALARAYRPSAGQALDANMVFMLIGQAFIGAESDWRIVSAEAVAVVAAAALAGLAVTQLSNRQVKPAGG